MCLPNSPRQGDLVVNQDLADWPSWYSTVFVVQCFSSATCMNYPWPVGNNMLKQPQRPICMFNPNDSDVRQVGYLLFSLWFAMHCSITAQAANRACKNNVYIDLNFNILLLLVPDGWSMFEVIGAPVLLGAGHRFPKVLKFSPGAQHVQI